MPADVRQYRVVGRVQGVGFRWFVRELARTLDVAGWVRNEADGAVVLVASATPDVLAKLEAGVRTGPSGARVDHVDVTVLPEAGHTLPRPFKVVREALDA